MLAFPTTKSQKIRGLGVAPGGDTLRRRRRRLLLLLLLLLPYRLPTLLLMKYVLTDVPVLQSHGTCSVLVNLPPKRQPSRYFRFEGTSVTTVLLNT